MKQVAFLCVLFLLFSCNRVQTDYDVIIVGGGLSGLSAAKELNSKKVLILEKDSILGGRVRTANFENKYYYDLGADYVIDSSFIKSVGLNNEIISQNEPMAYYIKGNFYFGNDVYECLSKISNVNKSILDSLYGNYDKNIKYLYDDEYI